VGVDERREASGQLVRDDLLLVVCDNAGMVYIPDPGPALPGPTGRSHYAVDGCAATRTADPATRRLFVLVEALPDGPPYHSLVEEYDDRYRLVARPRCPRTW
jgi:hypothetical protein